MDDLMPQLTTRSWPTAHLFEVLQAGSLEQLYNVVAYLPRPDQRDDPGQQAYREAVYERIAVLERRGVAPIDYLDV